MGDWQILGRVGHCLWSTRRYRFVRDQATAWRGTGIITFHDTFQPFSSTVSIEVVVNSLRGVDVAACHPRRRLTFFASGLYQTTGLGSPVGRHLFFDGGLSTL